MANISIIGVGRLGLCLALNLESKGNFILGVDVDPSYIDSLNNKTLLSSEPKVNELLANSKNASFTTDIEKAVSNDIIFVVVKTPSTPDWKYDHSYIDAVANQLIAIGKQDRRKDLIINSTTFPGYCDILHQKLKDYNYHVSYNPEFIAQGTIIRDQLNPDNVLIGQADEYAGSLIVEIYKSLVDSNPVFNMMTRTEAELTKLSVNCYLTTKISYANMVGDIAERLGCDPNVVLSAIGTDSRIGNKYLKPGFGFGGPCFPRDNRALAKCAEEVGIDAVISKATDEMNEKHLEYQIEQYTKSNPDKTKPVEIEFVTYKKESTILEESQQLKFALELKKLGYEIKLLDQRKDVLDQLNVLL